MALISVTLETSQLDKELMSLKLLQSANMAFILVTLETSQLDKELMSLTWFEPNMSLILVTLETSKLVPSNLPSSAFESLG